MTFQQAFFPTWAISRIILHFIEAIYGTRPWKVYGDGKRVRGEQVETIDAELRNAVETQKKGEHFNQRTTASPAFDHDEVRFTTKGNNFFIIVMNPAGGKLPIPSLGMQSELNPGRLKKLTQLYDQSKISFKQLEDKLIINMPPVNGRSLPIVLKGEFKNTHF